MVKLLWHEQALPHSNTDMKYLIFTFFVVFGLFHKISSSEFWPITISRTWLHPDRFETSMFQKPLLTFFLAFFHLLNVSDVAHLIIVKFFFSLFTAVGLFSFSYFVLRFHDSKKKPDLTSVAVLSLLFFICAPTFQENFFSVRSDQAAFVLFVLFLNLCQSGFIRLSALCLLIIPLMGIKESLFLLPGALYYASQFNHLLTKRVLFYGCLFSAAVLIWAFALNLDALNYLGNTYEEATFSRFASPTFISESTLLAGALISWIYFFSKKNKRMYPLCGVSMLLALALFLIPQSFDFFVASLIPFIYLPLILMLLQTLPEKKLLALTTAHVLFVIATRYTFDIQFYQTNLTQLKFISKISDVVHRNKLTYLDGIGILPKQTYLPCFVSPLDAMANNYCISLLKEKKPDVVIITNRLLGLGDQIFQLVQNGYTQLYPNFYVLNEYVTDEMKKQQDLSDKNGVPVFIF